ncbi:hypothetical protein M0R45_005431 [Rubus argutus]|uniref:Bulb-type lectin domain-containing protein n=1 Tax=Rubus argutus TaxID=59490 RepID=A0AAW1YMN5_RUBAR
MASSSSSSSVLVMFFLSTFVIISSMITVDAQRSHSNSHNISLDSSLSPNTNHSSWLSPSGRFAFGFYPQGNGFAVGIWLVNQPNQQVVVWTANRDDPPVSSNSSLTLKSDGMFLITDHGRHRREIPVANFSISAPNSVRSIAYFAASSPSPAISPPSSAAMLDSGNFVVYDNKSTVIWESFGFPTDTILGGQNLYAFNELVSSASISNHSSGRFWLKMQYDGNLVAYPVNSSRISENAYWSFGTADIGSNVMLRLNLSGFLVLLVNNTRYESRGVTMKSVTLANGSYHGQSGTVIHRATLDVDGIFRLYLHSNTSSRAVTVAWSALQNQCEVKGTCGLNSYCTILGNKPTAIVIRGL